MEEADIDERIILKRVLRKYGMKIRTGLMRLITSFSGRVSRTIN
jgi:hypothetical protein